LKSSQRPVPTGIRRHKAPPAGLVRAALPFSDDHQGLPPKAPVAETT